MRNENESSYYNMDKRKDENQLKYAQQHLANERTYLAWVRTAAAILGVGFLVTSLHLSMGISENLLIMILGISTGFLGIVTIILATISYFKKEKQIRKQTFYSSYIMIYFFSLLWIIIALVATLYITQILI
ncbi:YidH family protein [Natribacillus halophilus]|uniref:Putative membrane protein n=1 Tax=Natribacillus halophilus TaxID=549003 RepID=A0A1G8SNN3_9BACI|nr:DUF202 domain-containing protein [Natribacillus halophilus]SDJ30827.1 putative membrane protein [Natribacillus halophilus]